MPALQRLLLALHGAPRFERCTATYAVQRELPASSSTIDVIARRDEAGTLLLKPRSEPVRERWAVEFDRTGRAPRATRLDEMTAVAVEDLAPIDLRPRFWLRATRLAPYGEGRVGGRPVVLAHAHALVGLPWELADVAVDAEHGIVLSRVCFQQHRPIEARWATAITYSNSPAGQLEDR